MAIAESAFAFSNAEPPESPAESIFLFTKEFTPFYLWPYNGEMEIRNYRDNNGQYRLGFSGKCPHCGVISLFTPKSSVFVELVDRRIHGISDEFATNVTQCENCRGFALIIGKRVYVPHWEPNPYDFVCVYPAGRPDERLHESVPKEVAEDFKEAIRCHWIKAYRACVVMCGRALETSVKALNAQGRDLRDKIDNLATRGVITAPLKDFAHAIRATRNTGAHSDDLHDIVEKDSSDMMEFMREYLQHVYIMPAKLKARAPATKPASTP